ncbi:MAG: propionyl-CoA synthetase [Gammaproteobacteria bacterium]|nr:propionyl-CoA synthetase [Gammaproteobacteria bacterium]
MKIRTYEEAYRLSIEDPGSFWREAARDIDWFEFPASILDEDSNGTIRWFRGGKLNTAWLALDRHVQAGRGDATALIYDSPVTGQILSWSFAELTERVSRVAGGLGDLGVSKGDRVIVYMPMIPEAVIAMLACARIGAVHSVVFGGFAAPELAVRIDDANPKVVLSASCGIEFQTVIPYKPLLDEAIDLATSKPAHTVIVQRPQHEAPLIEGRDLDWDAWEASSEPAHWVEVDAWDPLYILYTSGTTGRPKGVVRDNGGHAVALNYSMDTIYGCDAGDVYWAASDVGWVVGHSYIVYGPLIKGCTTVLYEGKPVRTPDAGAIWRVIAEHGVKTFFVAPTAFRAVKKEDPDATLKRRYDISCLEYLFVAGERLDPPTYEWLKATVHTPVIDHWWQTETGWSICASMVGVADADARQTRSGSPGFPVPGYDLRVLDDNGNELGPDEEGNVVVKAPLPPGTLSTIWGDHQRYVEAYGSRYPGFYLTGDGGYRDADGYVYIMGRVDDVMNVAGHRLSTGELEEVVAAHPAVAECAVVGIADEDKGQVPLGLMLLKDGVNADPAELESELVQMVRRRVGAFANFKRALVVPRLPKTRSGKILRQVIRKIADGQPYEPPSTIDDPTILEEIQTALRERRPPP